MVECRYETDSAREGISLRARGAERTDLPMQDQPSRPFPSSSIAIDEGWLLVHSDAFHPGSREDCGHCQEMIRIYGEMPTPEAILAVRWPARGKPKAAIPDVLRWEVWERDNFTCQRCDTRRDLSIDHVMPESKGGSLELDNLQTLCRSCNSSKGAG